MSLGTNLFGSEIELISERSGKCLVRSIAGIECDGQNIGGTLRELSRRLGQTPGAARIASMTAPWSLRTLG